MEKYFSTLVFRIRNSRISKKRNEKRLKWLAYKKRYNRFKQNKSKELLKEESRKRGCEVVVSPNHLSMVEYTESTIGFINILETHYLNKKKVFLDIKNLKFIDHSAITILVSVIFTFKKRNIEFNGNLPRDEGVKSFLIDSDFFKYLNEQYNNKLVYYLGKKNQIFTKQSRKVEGRLGYKIIEEASKKIWGEKRLCKGVYKTMMELWHNTNNHADLDRKGVKHWWLSINHHPNEEKVSFYFVDYGIGIFESLNSRNINEGKLKTLLSTKSHIKLFKQFLDKKITLSVTGHYFRGKGIPGIYDALKRNQISNLTFVSNDLFADITNSNYVKLNNNFSGTFVTWELNKSNQNLEWKN